MSEPGASLGGQRGVKRARGIFAALLAAVLAADAAVVAAGLAHAHLPFENLPGFGAASGLLGALAVAGLAKLLGKALLSRGEDYYGK